MAQQHSGKRDQGKRDLDIGNERLEPGQSSRNVDPSAQGDMVDVARQQGTSQRGFTQDNPDQYQQQDVGSKISGDPGRGMKGAKI